MVAPAAASGCICLLCVVVVGVVRAVGVGIFFAVKGGPREPHCQVVDCPRCSIF